MEIEQGAAASTENLAVLVVDDDRFSRQHLALTLRRGGIEVEAADSGHAALEVLGRRRVHVLLADIMMPEMGGIELVRRVRARFPDLPVLLLTGEPEVDTAIAAVELGVHQYLKKPAHPEELVRAVRTAGSDGVRERTKRADVAALKIGFREALGTLQMAFQPIVHFTSLSTFAYEALVRPAHEVINNPGALFAAAERLGEIVTLGRAIRDAVGTVGLPPGDALLFVNVHPTELLDEELYHPSAPLSRYAPRIVLEITERDNIQRIDAYQERIEALRKMGFRMAIDDLGAGYSSLIAVAELQPEVVKLDMSLVRALHERPVRRQMVSSLVRMFNQLNALVVAEGVETQDEARVLLECGCSHLQGYYFGRPSAPFSLPVFPSMAPIPC